MTASAPPLRPASRTESDQPDAPPGPVAPPVVSAAPVAPALPVSVVAIAGLTCTGKTRFAAALVERLGPRTAVAIGMDAYYLDQSGLSAEARAAANHDRPESFDVELLAADVGALRAGRTIPKIAYDYRTKARSVVGTIEPRTVVIVEGIYALQAEPIRRPAGVRILIEGDPERLLARRLRRDPEERGYLPSVVRRKFLAAMEEQAPRLRASRAFADLVLPMDWTEDHVERAALLATDLSARPSEQETRP